MGNARDFELGMDVIIILSAKIMSHEISLDMVPSESNNDLPDKFIIEGFLVSEEFGIFKRDEVKILIKDTAEG